jgi:ABC-2 type transport system ATP-binding protein
VGLLHKGKLIQCDTPEVLRTQMKEPCYKIECQDPRRAKEILRPLDEVLSVEPFGAFLHLFLTSAVVPLDLVKSALDKNELGIISMQPIIPSLEDVFIALIRKQEAEA